MVDVPPSQGALGALAHSQQVPALQGISSACGSAQALFTLLISEGGVLIALNYCWKNWSGQQSIRLIYHPVPTRCEPAISCTTRSIIDELCGAANWLRVLVPGLTAEQRQVPWHSVGRRCPGRAMLMAQAVCGDTGGDMPHLGATGAILAGPAKGLPHKPAPACLPGPGSQGLCGWRGLPGKQYLSLPLLDYLKEISS